MELNRSKNKVRQILIILQTNKVLLLKLNKTKTQKQSDCNGSDLFSNSNVHNF